MATPFSDIYNKFLQKVTDYSFPQMTQADFELIANGYMISSCAKFKQCTQDLSDRTTTQFNVTLTDEEKEIIAKLMVVEWLEPDINDVKNIKQVLTDKDFKIYSQSQHLKTLLDLKKEMKKEINALISSYSYNGLGGSL